MSKAITDDGHMGQIRLAGNPEIAVQLRRSARARRLSLRLSQLDGRVTLTLPRGVTEAEGRAFLREKEDWLRKNLSRQEAQLNVGLGAVLPVAGAQLVIARGQGRQIVVSGDQLLVPGPPDHVARRVKGWLRTQARDHLALASDRYAAQLGKPYSKLTLRDTRSRWGSCTSDGGLMYSWRLILAPPQVLDYVAAHEVAHLAQMNHSPAFWNIVTDLYGDWKAPRTWLRTHGAGLHRFRFDD